MEVGSLLHIFMHRASEAGNAAAKLASNRPTEPCVCNMCVPMQEFIRLVVNQLYRELWFIGLVKTKQKP